MISGFVQSSIAAATNAYCAPQSLTLNMAQMLSGDGIKKDTDALGVLCVQIKRGIDLSVQDAGGSSDPYVVLSFAKVSTREKQKAASLLEFRLILSLLFLSLIFSTLFFFTVRSSSLLQSYYLRRSQPSLGRDRFPSSQQGRRSRR